jgi:hypothetical protein
MARRALDFALAHPQADAGYTAVVTRLQQQIAQADEVSVLQQTGDEREHAAIARRAVVREEIRAQHLLRLSRLAKRAAEEHPDLGGRFTMPAPHVPNHVFLIKAKGMLQDAVVHEPLLSTIGLGDNFVAELTQAVAALERATTDAHAARNDHVGATAQLERAASICSTDVGVLDTFMRTIFAHDAQALAAWRSARNLAGPFTSRHDAKPPAQASSEQAA